MTEYKTFIEAFSHLDNKDSFEIGECFLGKILSIPSRNMTFYFSKEDETLVWAEVDYNKIKEFISYR